MKKIAILIFSLLTMFFTTNAHAEKVYTALAVGSDSAWAWAAKPTQKKADKFALKQCNDVTNKHDCTLRVFKAIAIAEGETRVGYGYGITGQDEARKIAIDSCGASDCKITSVITSPGFFVLFKPESKGVPYLSYAFTNLENAADDAQSRCEKGSGGKCSPLNAGSIPGVININTQTPLDNSISEKNCRPNTPTIRCSSQCTNGNCVVTYENGCKMSVQVQPTFDSFNNQWTYPAPQC